MHSEWLFKLAFLLLFASAVAIRVHYQRLAGTYREGIATHTQSHLAHEAKPLLVIRPLLGFPWYTVVMCWFFVPQWISWSLLYLSLWARSAGLIVGGLGLLLLWRSHAALGRNFRPTLETAPDQELVTHGPYKHIRHPLYAAFLLMLAATGLLSSNWFIGVVGVLLIASITVVRIPAEEHFLRQRFGERYRVYRELTPALVPAFHSSARRTAAG